MGIYSLFQKFFATKRAATSIEYAVIAAGISIVIIVSGQIFAGKVTDMFLYIVSSMG